VHHQLTGRPVRSLARELQTNGHLRREAFSMSLYVAIVLLSALSIIEGQPPSRGTVFLLILGTTIGLVLAHGFAAWAASHIVRADDDGEISPWDVLRVQLGGAVLVAALAMLAVVLASTANELLVARITVSATIAALVFAESRRSHRLRRAAAYGLLALVAALIVAGLKTALVH
jgi:hypothetical protein